MEFILAPSLLAADPLHMGEQLREAEQAGAKMWHLDIMDGHFVPNLSFGPHICSGLRKYTSLPIDAHLMVSQPARFVSAFIAAGADSLTLHIESEPSEVLRLLLKDIKRAGKRSAVTIKPQTPIHTVLPFLSYVDMVLIMSVEPGYGGQALLPESFTRAKAMRRLLDEYKPSCLLQMDGGITRENIGRVAECGVNIAVAGSEVFASGNIAERTVELLRIANAALGCNN